MLVQPTVHGLVLRGVGIGSKCKLLFDVFELTNNYTSTLLSQQWL